VNKKFSSIGAPTTPLLARKPSSVPVQTIRFDTALVSDNGVTSLSSGVGLRLTGVTWLSVAIDLIRPKAVLVFADFNAGKPSFADAHQHARNDRLRQNQSLKCSSCLD